MDKKHYQKSIFFTSLIITISVFSIGLILNYALDYARIDAVLGMIESHELDTEAYIVEEEFAEVFNQDKCYLMKEKTYDLKKELAKVAQDLTNYGSKSVFKKHDFDYLKRRYFLLELKFYSLISELRNRCASAPIPILFFYEIDDDISTRQGYVLDDINQIDEFRQKIVILSLDKDYEDEPLIDMLNIKFNITKAPTIIINDEIKKEGIIYTSEINNTILKILNRFEVDPNSKDYNFSYVLEKTGTNTTKYIEELKLLRDNASVSTFAKADITLILGRITSNKSLICDSLKYYFNITPQSLEEEALIAETVASIDCRANVRAFQLKAAEIWERLGNNFRAQILKSLAYGNEVRYKSDIKDLQITNKTMENITKITVGASYFRIGKDDLIISQVDRVTRDWLSSQLYSSPYSENLLTVFSEKTYLPEDELYPDIGWHEGARIKELKSVAKHKVASGTIIKKIDDKWYAPNEKGVFMFDVPVDKVQYPTTRFLREDIAIIIDTHGINMLVEQAIRNNATVVIGCCDHVGKIKAVKYLSDKGIKSICFTDKYLPLLLNQDILALGSPPLQRVEDEFIVGKRPITFSKNTKIIVQDVSDITKVQSYYNTPARYFNILSGITSLNITYVAIDGFSQMGRIIEKAESEKAEIIAVRVHNSDDYTEVKDWLGRSVDNKAILFHSTSYPYGYKLFNRFYFQTSFDDINPIFS